ncbi:WD40 repeat-like protein [Hyaloscypha variabilis F]|uniref:WD40 repeat-like protein n=1 Tax=Hyaloscypha variabilis (strain UAMH 11265 / GT02V1 / F) TaxID=1149755 RepID=A0A2J6S4F7_HYAVF|nr:WD40 repeat-like protein [Hyaloscypha variabilis F]
MFEVLSQVFANQNSNKRAWATEDELTPQSISPKPLKPPSPAPLIATATSSLATTSRENRDQQLETETERTQHLQPSSSKVTAKKLQKFAFFQKLEGHSREVMSVAFSPDGRWLASGGSNGIQIWADRQGRFEQVQKLEGCNLSGDWSSMALAFSPDGRRLATAGYGYEGVDFIPSILIWADRQGRLEQVQSLQTPPSKSDCLWSVAFSPDGRRLASANVNGTQIWEDRQGRLEEVQRLEDSSGSFWSVAFSPDGRWLASGGSNGPQIWADRQGRLEKVQSLQTLKSENSWVSSVALAFSPDGRRLASANVNGIQIWADRQGRFELVQTLHQGHGDFSSSVAFSPDGCWLAGRNYDTIQIWKDRTSRLEQVQRLKIEISQDQSVAFSPDGRRLAGGGQDGTIWIWETEKATPIWKLFRGVLRQL